MFKNTWEAEYFWKNMIRIQPNKKELINFIKNLCK